MIGAPGSNIPMGPMTEAEAKKVASASSPAEAAKLEKAIRESWVSPILSAQRKQWFTDPAWSGGPPRWQVGLAGTGIAAALGVVIFGFLKK